MNSKLTYTGTGPCPGGEWGGMATQPKPERQSYISEAFDKLDKDCAVLSEAVGVLAERIQSILREDMPPPPPMNVRDEPKPQRTEETVLMVRKVNMLRQSILGTTEHVRSLTGRIEL